MNRSFENVSKFNKEIVDNAMKCAAAWSNGVQALAAETAEYAKTSVESGVSAFEKAAAANTAEKAFEAQSEYAKEAFERTVAQATKVGEIYADMTKDAFKPTEKAINKAK